MSGLIGSRADVDMTIMLAQRSEAELESARLFVADMAGRKGWSVEETKELMQALGLIEKGK